MLLAYFLGYIGIMQSEIKIGKQLKICRETLKPKKTQQKIADELGIQRTYLSALERNEGLPSYDLLLRMADYYNTTTDWILGHNEEQKILPEGATEVIGYFAGMSNRGREQLLEVTQILYKNDLMWKKHDDLRKGITSVLGEATVAAIEAELPAMLAESTSTDTIARRIRDTLGKNLRGDSS